MHVLKCLSRKAVQIFSQKRLHTHTQYLAIKELNSTVLKPLNYSYCVCIWNQQLCRLALSVHEDTVLRVNTLRRRK